MVAICCCQCDPRLATYAIAFLSFLHFGIQSILIMRLDDEHAFVAEDDGIKFYTVLITHMFVMIAAIPLFVAAYRLQTSLCLPWLFGCAFTLLLYSAIFVLILIRIVNGGDLAEMERALFLAFLMAAIVYAMWIVIVFTTEVRAHAYDGDEYGGDSSTKSLFTLYDDDFTTHDEETETEEDLFVQKKNKSNNSSRTGMKASRTGMNKSSHKKMKEDRTPLIHNP